MRPMPASAKHVVHVTKRPSACDRGSIQLPNQAGAADLPENDALDLFMTDERFDPGDAFRERVHAGTNPL